MNCAPEMKYKRKKGIGENPVSMQMHDIRRRIVRRQRENKLPVRRRFTLAACAYELKRLYGKWVKAGASGPCPSLIHASSFRDPGLDTLSKVHKTRAKVDPLGAYSPSPIRVKSSNLDADLCCCD